jgi:hypothetical protein
MSQGRKNHIIKHFIIYNSLTYMIEMIRSRRMRWPGNVAHEREREREKHTQVCGAQK